jgi:hypothetical protein
MHITSSMLTRREEFRAEDLAYAYICLLPTKYNLSAITAFTVRIDNLLTLSVTKIIRIPLS